MKDVEFLLLYEECLGVGSCKEIISVWEEADDRVVEVCPRAVDPLRNLGTEGWSSLFDGLIHGTNRWSRQVLNHLGLLAWSFTHIGDPSSGKGACLPVFLDDELGSGGFDSKFLSCLAYRYSVLKDKIDEFLSFLVYIRLTAMEILACLKVEGIFSEFLKFWIRLYFKKY